MNLEQKKEVALFRMSVIGDMVGGIRLNRGEKTRLIREKSEKRWNIPLSDRSRISVATIRRWIVLYEKSGRKIESLFPNERIDRGRIRALDEETALALLHLKEEKPDFTVPALIREMEKRGLATPGSVLCESTVYRFLKRKGAAKKTEPADRRRFEAETPNDVWQADVLHGPPVLVDGKRRKTYLIAFIDDHSRLIPHGQFYLSENLECFLDAFEYAILTRGLPRKLYVDNGSAFRSKHLEYLTASLGVALIHSPPYTPQGRGKIERFFRTVRQQALSLVEGDDLAALNVAFELWVAEDYHRRRHSVTGQSPLERFAAHVELVRPAPADLKDHFRKRARRRVAKDRTVSLDGRLYEAPVNLMGERIELLYHADSPQRVEIRFKDEFRGFLAPLDVYVNGRVKRDRSGIEVERKDESPPERKGGQLTLGDGGDDL